MEQRDIQELLNEFFIKHEEISENKLAKALDHLVSQKTINRYRNGAIKTPNEKKESVLLEYFELVDKGEIKAGDSYKKWKMDSERANFGFDMEEFKKQEQVEKEAAIYYQEQFEKNLREGLQYYNQADQKQIINQLDLILCLPDEDLAFIRKYQKLSESAKEWLRNFMSRIPESSRLLSEIHGLSEAAWYMGQYQTVMEKRSKDAYEAGYEWEKHGIKPYAFCGSNKEKPIRVVESNLIGIDQWMDSFRYFGKRQMNQAFFDIADEVLRYTDEEWYMLYLYKRTEVSDLANQVYDSQEQTVGVNLSVVNFFLDKMLSDE